MFFTIIVFFLILSILVLVHELGHFWVARKCGLIPEEFGFGFPPRAIGIQRITGDKIEKISSTEEIGGIISEGQASDGTEVIEQDIVKNVNEVDRIVPFERWRIIKGGNKPEPVPGAKLDTVYSLNWLPLGGFVNLGEDDDPGDNPNHFNNKPIRQRALILAAGVTMNFLLAAVLLSVGFMIGTPQALVDLPEGANIGNRQIQIMEVLSGSPAERGGVKAGDVIVSVNDLPIVSTDQMEKIANDNQGKELIYKIKRGDSEIVKTIAPEFRADTQKGGIGVGIVETGVVRYHFFRAIYEGCKSTIMLTWTILVAFYDLIKNLIVGKGVGGDLSGPVGIAVLTGQVARMGFIYILQFTALLSINLAIINALPFPALDGGRLLFLAIEAIKGSPVKKEVEGTIHYIGFILLMILIAVVTFRDVAKYADGFKVIFSKIF